MAASISSRSLENCALQTLPWSLPANGNRARADVETDGPPSQVRIAARRLEGGPSETVEALVHAACARDPRAQARIWRKYTPLVRARLRASAGARDLDDLVQEVFVRLFARLPALREPAALRSFIVGISLRVAGTELRRRRSRWWLRLLPADVALDELSTSYQHDEVAQMALVRFDAILATLTPRARRVFELRYVEKKGLKEVADQMGISLATAKRHLARAQARVGAMVAHDESFTAYMDESTKVFSIA